MNKKNLNDDNLTYCKVTTKLIDEKELELFDNCIHQIVEEYSKMHFKKRDEILTQRLIIKQEEEIKELQQRIDKAIKELENLINILEGIRR